MLNLLKTFLRYIIINFYSVSINNNSSKKALLCYIVHPYLKNDKTHPNAIEVKLMVDLMVSIGYSVRVVDYRKKYVNGSYDLCLGFGDAYEFVLKNKLAKKNILYSTGSPFPFQNKQTLLSLKRFLDRDHVSNFSDIINGLRFTENPWPLQLVSSDAIITIGNDFTRSLFCEYHNIVYTLPAVFYEPRQLFNFIENRDIKSAKKKFLWFGGKGSIHKGLDLCIDVFKELDADLYIAGNLSAEMSFFENELASIDNIKYVGFLSVGSESFYSLMQDCCYVILPSCSEGTATSILTVCGSAGLIPIISKECGIDMDDDVIAIEALDLKSLKKSVEFAINMTEDDIISKSISFHKKVNRNHTGENFTKKLNYALVDLEC